MKLAIAIIQISLSVIGIIIYIRLSKYCKKYANEEIETHKQYIFSRLIAIFVLVFSASILGIVNAFINNSK